MGTILQFAHRPANQEINLCGKMCCKTVCNLNSILTILWAQSNQLYNIESRKMADKKTNLIWLDLEMTGLNTAVDRILEIATIVTDTALNVVAVGPELVISQPEKVILQMDEWCTTQHNATGLVEKVLNSSIDEAIAEQKTLDFLMQHVDAQCSPMCGNTICMDRRFLALHMPKLEAFFHYRNLDVSSVKILYKMWKPDNAKALKKESRHRALEDIQDSIDELKYYREHFLKV